MPITSSESEDLIERILASPGFAVAPDQCRLLKFLYLNQVRKLQAADIETLHFKHALKDQKHNPAHSRERVSDLKTRLVAYAKSARKDKWECKLPDAEKGAGYKLQFVPSERTAPERIWGAHLDAAEDLIMVTGSHLFFFHPTERKIIRYGDFNVDTRKEETKEAFKLAHPEIEVSELEPWHNTYLTAGDIKAHEALLRFFYERTGIFLKRLISREINDYAINRAAPILTGRTDTNPYMAGNLESREAAHLGFCFLKKGFVQIKNMTEDERAKLAGLNVQPNGIIVPSDDVGPAFGLFTRMRNPNGYGHVTHIACGFYAMVIARIVESTVDERQAGELLKQMDWPSDREMPDSFEMLFSVELSPGKREGEGRPKLLLSRIYDEPAS